MQGKTISMVVTFSFLLASCASDNAPTGDCDLMIETMTTLVQSARDAKNSGDEAGFRYFIDEATKVSSEGLKVGC